MIVNVVAADTQFVVNVGELFEQVGVRGRASQVGETTVDTDGATAARDKVVHRGRLDDVLARQAAGFVGENFGHEDLSFEGNISDGARNVNWRTQ